MLARWQFRVTTAVALREALAAGYNMMLFGQNRTTQREFARRAQYVLQSFQIEGLYREMVKALADLSIRHQDQALRDLLGSQGITVNPSSDGPFPAPPAPADASK